MFYQMLHNGNIGSKIHEDNSKTGSGLIVKIPCEAKKDNEIPVNEYVCNGISNCVNFVNCENCGPTRKVELKVKKKNINSFTSLPHGTCDFGEYTEPFFKGEINAFWREE